MLLQIKERKLMFLVDDPNAADQKVKEAEENLSNAHDEAASAHEDATKEA